jgi:hypothetical protein
MQERTIGSLLKRRMRVPDLECTLCSRRGGGALGVARAHAIFLHHIHLKNYPKFQYVDGSLRTYEVFTLSTANEHEERVSHVMIWHAITSARLAISTKEIGNPDC